MHLVKRIVGVKRKGSSGNRSRGNGRSLWGAMGRPLRISILSILLVLLMSSNDGFGFVMRADAQNVTTASPAGGTLVPGATGSGSGPLTTAVPETPSPPLFNISFQAQLFTSGDMIMRNPVEGSTIFVTAVLVASVVEWLIDYLRAIESDSFQLVFESVREETLIVGVMTLLLIFVLSLGLLRTKWVIMLNYAVMSLLLMVVFFVIIISSMVIVLRIQLNKWQEFERVRMDADPLLSSKELTFKQCRDRFRESVVAMDAKFNIDVLFSEYLKRVQRFTVARIADLSWKSWACLGLLIIINGVRSRFTTGFTGGEDSELTRNQRLANVASYIGFVGYGTLLFYFILHLRLSRQLTAFASEPAAEKKKYVEGFDIKSSSKLLFFGSLETTAQILQSTILFMEWYMAVFALGMVFESWREFKYTAFALYIAAIIPPVVFVGMIPWTLTIVAILSALGTDLKIEDANACFDELDEVRGGGVSKTKEKSVAHQVRNDEYNGAEMVTLHASAKNPNLDNQTPLLIQDARHVNAPEHQGYLRREPRPAFPLSTDQAQAAAIADARLAAAGLPIGRDTRSGSVLSSPAPAPGGGLTSPGLTSPGILSRSSSFAPNSFAPNASFANQSFRREPSRTRFTLPADDAML